jgi:hypothetical protein
MLCGARSKETSAGDEMGRGMRYVAFSDGAGSLRSGREMLSKSQLLCPDFFARSATDE